MLRVEHTQPPESLCDLSLADFAQEIEYGPPAPGEETEGKFPIMCRASGTLLESRRQILRSRMQVVRLLWGAGLDKNK